VCNIYEGNRLSSVEAKTKVVDSLIKKLIWGKATPVDSLLRDAHANIIAFDDTI